MHDGVLLLGELVESSRGVQVQMGIVYYMLNVSKMQGIRRKGVLSRVPIGTINYILTKVFSSKKKKKRKQP